MMNRKGNCDDWVLAEPVGPVHVNYGIHESRLVMAFLCCLSVTFARRYLLSLHVGYASIMAGSFYFVLSHITGSKFRIVCYVISTCTPYVLNFLFPLIAPKNSKSNANALTINIVP